MHPLFGYLAAGLVGAVLGGFAVIGWLRSKYEQPPVEAPVACYPPVLTVIEGGLRTGTDRY